MEITEVQRGFEIRFNYDPSKVEAVKSIRNSYWNSQGKFWFVPGHRENEVNMLKKRYGIMTEPVIQMPEQFGEIDPMPDLLIDLPLERNLFPFQKKGVARGMELKRLINGDQPGLGKSTQAIGTAMALDCKCILVICPNTLKDNWQNEWKIVAGKRSMILSDKNKSSWINYYKVGMINVFIVNYESLKKYFVQAGWEKPKERFKMSDIPFRECVDIFDCVIVDESHSVKEPTTLQSKLVRGICYGKQVVQLLTGTPLINKPKDIAHQLMVINKLKDVVQHIPQPVDKYGRLTDNSGWTRFINRYCDGGGGSSNLKELNYRLNKFCFFRREKKEVLPDLPDKMRQIIECDITNRKEYIQCEKDFINYLKETRGCSDPEVRKKLRGQMLVKMNLLRQIAAKGKIDAAKEYVDEVTGGGEKIVIFIYHKEITALLKEQYSNLLTVVGDDDKEDRTKAISLFQNNPDYDKIACSLKAGGVGITLTASSEVLLIELPFTDALIEQAIDRTHRIGQVKKVRAALLIGKDTIDEYVYYEIIQKKRDLHMQVTGSHESTQDEIVDGLLRFFANRTESE